MQSAIQAKKLVVILKWRREQYSTMRVNRTTWQYDRKSSLITYRMWRCRCSARHRQATDRRCVHTMHWWPTYVMIQL